MSAMEPVSFLEEKLAFVNENLRTAEHDLRIRRQHHDQLCLERARHICGLRTQIDVTPMGARRSSLEHEVHMIEREQRDAQIALWRDLVDIQRELRALKEECRALRGMLSWTSKPC